MSKITSIDAVRDSEAFQKLSLTDQAEATAVLRDASADQIAAYFGRGVDRDELRDLLAAKPAQPPATHPYFTPALVPPRPMFANLTAEVACKTEYVHQIDFDISEVRGARQDPSDTELYNCDRQHIRSTVKSAVEAQTGRRVKAVFAADQAAEDALNRGLNSGDGTLRLPVRVVFAR